MLRCRRRRFGPFASPPVYPVSPKQAILADAVGSRHFLSSRSPLDSPEGLTTYFSYFWGMFMSDQTSKLIRAEHCRIANAMILLEPGHTL